MKLELREFVDAVKTMHSRSGVRRTRLMIKLRPFHTKKTFVMKATDGHTTVTTRVAHQGQLKMVENLVSAFVTRCTAASLHASTVAAATTGTESSAANASGSAQNQSEKSSAAAPRTAAQTSAKKSGGGNTSGGGNNNNKGGGKKKGKK